MTRQVEFGVGETPRTVLCKDLLQLFSSGSDGQYFLQLNAVCRNHGHQLAAMLLPDIPVNSIVDATPAWAIFLDKLNVLNIRELELGNLKGVIQQRSGGSIPIGKKGLIYGTSAVECALSKTDAAFPGDADAVIFDSRKMVRYVVEFKKHNLPESIGSHLISRYYPNPDGRKYKRLSALVSYYRTYNSDVQLIIFYYSTKTPEVRFQLIDVPIGGSANVLKDSSDLQISGLTHLQVATIFTNWLGIHP